jgi:tetratricopeptide (TPR) repeat protein
MLPHAVAASLQWTYRSRSNELKVSIRTICLAALPFAVAVVLASCGGKEERKAMHMEKGMAYYAQGNYDKARVELKNVLQIDPKTPEAYYMIGLIEEKQQKWQGAFSSYLKAVELNPDHIQAKVKLGRLYLLSGGLREAEEIMTDVLARRPGDPGGRFLKAAVLVRRGDIPARSRRPTKSSRPILRRPMR